MAVKGLYDGIKTQVSQRMVTVEQEAQQRLAEMQKTLADTQRLYEQLLKEHQFLQAQFNLEQTQVKKLEQEITQRDQRIENTHAENRLLQARLADKTEEIARLSAQVLQSQTNFEHYTEAAGKQREEERQRFEMQIKTLEVKDQQNQEMIAQQQKTIVEQTKTMTLLEAEKNQHEQALVKAEERLQILRVEFEAFKNQHLQLQNQHIFAVKQHERMVEELNQLKSSYQDLQGNFASNTERLQITEVARQKAEDELILLRDKLLFLTHEKSQLQAKLETFNGRQ